MNTEKFLSIRSLLYDGNIKVVEEVERKISERIKFWSKYKKSWTCLLLGHLSYEANEAIPVITDFFEIQNLTFEEGLAFNLQDVLRVAENYFVVAILCAHPSEDLTPSASEFAFFLYLELLFQLNNKNPIFYIIASPSGKKLIFSFTSCRRCSNSFFKILIEKLKGGE